MKYFRFKYKEKPGISDAPSVCSTTVMNECRKRVGVCLACVSTPRVLGGGGGDICR